MVEPLRHRQSKEAATDMCSLQPPRHISTLPIKARASGCDDFLTKPIDEALLFQMLNRYLGTNVT